MPIIAPTLQSNKKMIRGRISAELEKQLQEYMSWAGVKKMDDFLEQAIQFVLKSDREWKKKGKKESKEGE